MNELLNNTYILTPIAFAMTYLLHSTIWILAVALLLKLPFFQATLVRNYLWKMALIGGLTTSLFAAFYGSNFLHIPILEGQTETVVATKNTAPSILSSPNSISAIPTTTSQATNSSTATITIVPSQITTAQSIFSLNTMLLLLLGFWAIGSLFILLKYIIQHRLFFKKIAPRQTVINPNSLYILKGIQQKAELNQSIQLSQSDKLNSPILIRNNEICLPEKAVENLNHTQLEGILAHEMAHIARKDYQWSCALAVFEILFFFQPLHHWAITEIKNTNELLCDAWAAKLTGDNIALAQCLLTVAEWVQESHQPFAFVRGMSLKKSELTTRVHSLLDPSSASDPSFSLAKKGFVFAVLLGLGFMMLPGFSFSTFLDSAIAKQEKNTSIKEPIDEVAAIRIAKQTGPPEPKTVLVTASTPIKTKKKSCSSTSKCTNLSRAEIEAMHPKDQCSILLEAVKKNHTKRVGELVKFVNVDCLWCGGTAPSAPINAAARNGNLEIANILLQSGAYLYSKGWSDEGAVIAAARNGNVAMMRLFDEYGAYFDLEVDGHGTPLINAVRNGQHKMVQYLLENGADPLIEDEAGKNALDYAQTKGERMLHLLAKFQSKQEIEKEKSLTFNSNLQFEEAYYYIYLT